MTDPNDEYPPLDELADENDQLDWDRAALGPMLAAAGPDEIETVPYDPATDPYLQEG